MADESLRRHRHRSPALIALPRLATAYINTAIVTLGLPAAVVAAVGDAGKGRHLGLATAAGAAVSIGVLWAAGSLSDRTPAVVGRLRLPAAGLAAALLPLAALAIAPGYPGVVAATLALIAARALCDASHLPLLAQRLEGMQPARFSTFIAFYHFLGAGLGALVFAASSRLESAFGVRAPVALAGLAVTVAALAGFRAACGRLPPVAHPAAAPQQPPLREAMTRDLLLLLAARTFFLAGTLIVTTFLYYLARDVLGAVDPERTTGLLYAAAIAGAVTLAVPLGRFGEAVGEVRILLGSGAAIAAVAPVFLVVGPRYPAVAVVCMLVYGGCSAALIGSGISFLVKLVPHPAVAGRVMAVFTAGTFASQLVASLTGAALLDPLDRIRPGAGYAGLLVALELFFALGAVFLLRVRTRGGSA